NLPAPMRPTRSGLPDSARWQSSLWRFMALFLYAHFRRSVAAVDRSPARVLDHRRASFDKLRMRSILCATKISPHPELVEGRSVLFQLTLPPRVAVRTRRGSRRAGCRWG